MTAYSANYLTREQTGYSIYQHLIRTPSPAAEVASQSEEAVSQRKLRAAKHEYERLQLEQPQSVSDEVKVAKTKREAWKAQREKEIQDDLDVGKGFGDMIMDQIWEVWNWGKKRDGEDDGDD